MNVKLFVVAAILLMAGFWMMDWFLILAGIAMFVIVLVWDNQTIKGKINNIFDKDKIENASRIGVPCCSTCGVEYAHDKVNEWQPKCEHNKEMKLSVS